ncbi:MFS transporter [Halalkalibacter akibai]|uniref:Major facilitator superfamily MFS_1 n=1 Tax=Halalkalibacter akibai (strain ATCC 43226 / DSM 21942 / CIP 109018 / JCM 9157 / 1139) TaxID=1236973 RepID=W4QTT0_HALA3|nr:MFS transporter [Halalkalibacter akibai]GAE35327.1 major facilitator superfamily MFS_1 [Halalkalibacter akibai JCM 9157]
MNNSNRVLWFLAIAQFFVMQVWFNYSSIIPVIETEWNLTSSQSGVILAFFHIGYVIAIIFYSFLITAYNPKYSFVFGAFLAGISGLAFAFWAEGFWSALLLRTLSGIGVAGIYVPGMKMVAEIFPPKKRGRALGIYVGSLVVGSGSSLLISAMFINIVGWQGVIIITSLLSIVAALLILIIRIPTSIKLTSQSLTFKKLKGIFKKRNLLINAGYTGHCFELYAVWSWIGPFLVFYFSNQGYEQGLSIQLGNTMGAFIIIIGGFATYIGGRLSDKYGRGQIATIFLIVSITCTLSIGWLSFLPLLIMLPITLLYGFTIVADSPIYNTAITEVTDPELLGIALGVQSVLGFSATIFAPLIFGIFLNHYSWGLAFMTVGFISLFAPICMYFLSKQKINSTNL